MAVVDQMERCRMTLEKFEELPEGPPFYDYIDGWAIKLNRPAGKQSEIEIELAHFLRRYALFQRLGLLYARIDVKLPSGDWVGPDIVFISREHRDRYNEEKGDLYGSPDLVVEITSSSSEEYDRFEKMNLYERNGVPWLWIVYQHNLGIEEFQLTPDGYLRTAAVESGKIFRPRLFDGLEIDLAALVAPAQPVEQPGSGQAN